MEEGEGSSSGFRITIQSKWNPSVHISRSAAVPREINFLDGFKLIHTLTAQDAVVDRVRVEAHQRDLTEVTVQHLGWSQGLLAVSSTR